MVSFKVEVGFGEWPSCPTPSPSAASVGDDEVLMVAVGLVDCKIHSCWKALSGFNRFAGSHSRHCLIKSKNNGSLHLNACAKFFVPALRFLPRELQTTLGSPRRSNFKR